MASPDPSNNPLFREPTADHPPRVGVIAELGVNHDGDRSVALQLVEAAADAGADAVKVQVFHPDRLLSNQAFLAAYQEANAEDPHAMLKRLAMGVPQLAPIAERARARGLRFIATPFSPGDMDDLRALDVDAVKIASPDAVNPPLLEAAAALGKPMLISTGTCALEELSDAAQVIARCNTGGVGGSALLHCVSCYPTPRASAALGAIGVLREAFATPIGYSDHTTAIDMGALAVAGGAVVLEKHLTHDKSAPGPDHAASLTGAELAAYVRAVREAESIVGSASKEPLEIEGDVRGVSRQSVCFTRDLPGGHVLSAGDLTIKRPGTGIPAAKLSEMIGRQLANPATANDLLTPRHLA